MKSSSIPSGTRKAASDVAFLTRRAAALEGGDNERMVTEIPRLGNRLVHVRVQRDHRNLDFFRSRDVPVDSTGRDVDERECRRETTDLRLLGTGHGPEPSHGAFCHRGAD